MKRKHKFYVIAVIMTIVYSISTGSIFAATPRLGGRYSSGVGNITIFINYNSGAGYWESFIKNAANNWMYTGKGDNPIYISFVSSNYGSSMDIYSKRDSYWTKQGQYGVLAETFFYNSSSKKMQPNAGNWLYTEIYINDDNYKKSSFSNDQALGTLIHEMGHAFGLAHYNSNPNSIMCQTNKGRKVQRVQKTDNDTINAIY